MPSTTTLYLSPLRYPGGKARLAAFVGELMAAQRPRPSRYVEPFAGGAGVALRLLFDERVDEIVINDLNAGVAAFWRALYDSNDQFADMVRECRPTIEQWHEQRAVYEAGAGDDLTLGFATFFLNRANRSGILGARPIGGLNQSGRWKIDARYDADKLADRVELLGRYASRVAVCEEDGVDLVSRTVGQPGTFVYADPPYLVQGDELYLNTFQHEHHERLAQTLGGRPGWLVTYDADPRVPELYDGLRCAEFSIKHTAAKQHVGREYAVFADGLRVPSIAALSRHADAAYV